MKAPAGKMKWGLFAAALAAIVLAAALLTNLRYRLQLGEPGVRLVDVPMLDEEGNPVGSQSVALPERVGDYWSTNGLVTKSELKYLPADTTYGKRSYFRPDGKIDVTVVLMKADRTSIHKPELCLTGLGWNPGPPQSSFVPVSIPHSYRLDVTRLVGRQSFEVRQQRIDLSAVYAYWFVSGRHLTASHRERFWISLKELIRTGVLTRWAYVGCFALCEPGKEEATFEKMKDFIAQATPEFQLISRPDVSRSGNTTPPRP